MAGNDHILYKEKSIAHAIIGEHEVSKIMYNDKQVYGSAGVSILNILSGGITVDPSSPTIAPLGTSTRVDYTADQTRAVLPTSDGAIATNTSYTWTRTSSTAGYFTFTNPTGPIRATITAITTKATTPNARMLAGDQLEFTPLPVTAIADEYRVYYIKNNQEYLLTTATPIGQVFVVMLSSLPEWENCPLGNFTLKVYSWADDYVRSDPVTLTATRTEVYNVTWMTSDITPISPSTLPDTLTGPTQTHTFTFEADNTWELPSTITITPSTYVINRDYTWNISGTTGTLTLRNIKSDLGITIEAEAQRTVVYPNPSTSHMQFLVDGEPAPTSVRSNQTIQVDVVPDTGYILPVNLTFTGTSQSTYSAYNKTLTLSRVRTDLTIDGTASLGYNFTFDGGSYVVQGTPQQNGCPSNGTISLNLSVVSGSRSSYDLPMEISISPAGAVTSTWTRADDGFTGVLTLTNATQDFAITAHAVRYYTFATKELVGVTANPTIPNRLHQGETFTTTLTANENYDLPDTITTANVSGNWDRSTGTLTLSQASGSMTLRVIGETAYMITTSVDGMIASSSNPDRVRTGHTVQLYFTAASGYITPASVTSPSSYGAYWAPTTAAETIRWTKTSDSEGYLTITNPSSNISVTMHGYALYTVTNNVSNVTPRSSNPLQVAAHTTYDLWYDCDNEAHDYVMPNNITVTGVPSGSWSWNGSTTTQSGRVHITNATGNVTIAINGVRRYAIIPTLTDVSASSSNVNTILVNGTRDLIYTTTGNLALPAACSPTNVGSFTWTVNDTTQSGIQPGQRGVLHLANPTDDVTFALSAVTRYTITPTTTQVNPQTGYTNRTYIRPGERIELRYQSASGYVLPTANPGVSGASFVSWTLSDNNTKGSLVIENATSDVGITIVAIKLCSISYTSSSITHTIPRSTNPTTILAQSGVTAELYFDAEAWYELPTTIPAENVTNANFTWDSTTGRMVLSNATDDINITVTSTTAVRYTITLIDSAFTGTWIQRPPAEVQRNGYFRFNYTDPSAEQITITQSGGGTLTPVWDSAAGNYKVGPCTGDITFVIASQLTPPILSLNGDVLILTPGDNNTTSFDVYADGTYKTNVPLPTQSEYTVGLDLKIYGQDPAYWGTYIKVYDGQDSTGALLAQVTASRPNEQTPATINTSVTDTTGYLYIEWFSENADYLFENNILQTGSTNCTISEYGYINAEKAYTIITLDTNTATVVMTVQYGLD
ncbi:MAG: hypothetical protein J6S67_07675 [Methanobrevibacter sp.]|nr:hypothetical protein [Methanobrevibacter sp.]